MKIRDRMGSEYTEEKKTEAFFKKAYSSAVSRSCLKILSAPFISRAAGLLLDSKLSADLAYWYADRHNIHLFDY